MEPISENDKLKEVVNVLATYEDEMSIYVSPTTGSCFETEEEAQVAERDALSEGLRETYENAVNSNRNPAVENFRTDDFLPGGSYAVNSVSIAANQDGTAPLTVNATADIDGFWTEISWTIIPPVGAPIKVTNNSTAFSFVATSVGEWKLSCAAGNPFSDAESEELTITVHT